MTDRFGAGEDVGRARSVATIVAFGCLPFATLLAANQEEALDLARLGLIWGATLGVLLGCLLVFDRWRGAAAARRAAVVAAVPLYLFFQFPMVANFLDTIGVDPDLHVAGWTVFTVTIGGAMVPLSRRSGVQIYGAVVGIALLAVPAGQLVVGIASARPGVVSATGGSQRPEVSGQAGEVLPSIYLFVVDGYGRPDVLETLFDVEPDHEFAAGLTERGFRLPGQARANYPTTFLSVGSLLEMDYVLDVDQRPFPPRVRFDRMLRGDNETVEVLRSLGYRYLHAPPALWQASRCDGHEDVCIDTAGLLGETEWALLQRTPLGRSLSDRYLNERAAPASDPAAVVRAALDQQGRQPTFLFAHLMAPHPPYLYDAACDVRTAVPYDLVNWRPRDLPRYADAIRCLNRQLIEAVDAILAVDDDPVIVVQADHGPEFLVDWLQDAQSWTRRQTLERTAVMSAVRLPSGCGEAVPDDLTPVNVMRLVLGCVTTEAPPLLPNRSYVGSFKRQDMVPAQW